ncbi:MAG: hypothetical protein IT259_11915 [Saprospiraceae bacterium]|nr:hypothetical protein [Saprospiraceae bacterium]
MRTSTRPQSAILLPAFLLLFSPQLSWFAAQYPKNLLGLVLFLGFVFSLPERPGPGWRAWFAPIFLLIINYFGHRLMFGLALIYLSIWVLSAYGNGLLAVLRQKKVLVAAAGAGVALLLAAAFFPGLFHLTDFERLNGLLAGKLQFAPWSFIQDFGWGRMSFWWLAEIGLTLALWLWTAVYFLNKKQRAQLSLQTQSLFLLGFFLLLPVLEWSVTGLAYRLFVVFVLIAPLLAAGILKIAPKWHLTLCALLAVAAIFSWKSYRPAQHDPDYRLFDHLVQTAMADSTFRSVAPLLVVAPNTLAEYFTFQTGIDAMPWLPEYAIEPARLWRIAGGMREKTVSYYAQAPVRRLPGGYLLLREDHWQNALTRAKAEGDTAFVEMATGAPNPSRIRPAYLLRRKK